MTVHCHKGDLPMGILATGPIAIDTETMGLNPHRDRLCLVQLSDGGPDEHLIRVAPGQTDAPNLTAMLADPGRLKIFHFGRFDLAVLAHAFGVMPRPVYCTKIASKLIRTYTDRHGLKDVLKETINVDISKQQQSSDWGAEQLSDAQKEYAASDVRYLHRAMAVLDERLAREGRDGLARACFEFLPVRAALDLAGWPDIDLFAHS